MSDRPNIKILISCHKEVDYPKSSCFLPVHVGAEGKRLLPHMQPDNEGDNISDRNFTYCELSAQYWAWKNLDADYVGQCHYRRYFYFGDGSYPTNDHAQIEIEMLSPYTRAQYQLDDESLICQALEGADGVIAHTWDVSKTNTPDGMKDTVRDHMVGYGLVADEDFDRLIEITTRLKPEYADELKAYLNGSSYLGYNCFILKRELFDRLCSFEFPILQEFDATFDYSGLTTTRKRICGYFGEVLYSVFINHLKAEGGWNFVEKPLLFFDATPAPLALDDAKKGTGSVDLHIVWKYDDPCAPRFAVAADSLIDHLHADRRYRLTIVHDRYFQFGELKRFLRSMPENLIVDDATVPAFSCAPIAEGLNETEFETLLPYLLAESDTYGGCDRMLWVDGMALFNDDPLALVAKLPSAPFVALNGLYLQKELNKPSNKEVRGAYLQSVGSAVTLDADVLLMDTDYMRQIGRSRIISVYRDLCGAFDLDLTAKMHEAAQAFEDIKEYLGVARDQFTPPVEYYALTSALLISFGAKPFAYQQVLPAVSEGDLRAWGSEDDVKQWSAVSDSVMFSYKPEVEPLIDLSTVHGARYWKYARQSDAYEILLTLIAERPQKKVSLKNRLLPPFSRRRRLLGKIRQLLTGKRK